MAPPLDLCAIPAAKPPSGLLPNFVDPPSLAPVMMTVMGILVLWATLFVGIRFFMNIRKLTCSDSSRQSLLRHMWDVPACAFDAAYTKYGVYLPALFLVTGTFLAKASILMLLRQIFHVEDSMRVVIWIGLALDVLIYLPSVVVATYFQAPHPGEHWMNVLNGRALVPLKWWQTQSILSVVLDVYMFILPLPIILKMQMPARKLLQAVAVFSLALLGIIASIASCVERFRIATSKDQTWIAAVLQLCSYVELNVAIIVGCAPSFAGCICMHLYKLTLFLANTSGGDSSIRHAKIDPEGGFNASRGELERPGVAGTLNAVTYAPEDLNGKYFELENSLNAQPGQIIRTVTMTQETKRASVNNRRE